MPRPTRVTAVLGLAWLVLFIVGGPVLQGRPPATDTAVAVLRDGLQGRYLLGDFVAGCGFALGLLPFATLLPYALAERPHPVWSRLTTAAAVALTVTGGVATSFLDAAAIAQGGATPLDDSTLTALLAANAAGIALIGLPAAVFATSAAVLLWQGRARAAAVTGWVAGPLLVAGAAFPLGSPGGPLWTVRFAGFVVLAAFVLIASVTLLRRR